MRRTAYAASTLHPRSSRTPKGQAGRLEGTDSSPPLGRGAARSAPSYDRGTGYAPASHDLHGGTHAEDRWEGAGVARRDTPAGQLLDPALESLLGDVTDALDALEYSPGMQEWGAQMSAAEALFASFLCRHAEARDRVPPSDLQGFDYWFRPKVREVVNWFHVAKAKRALHLSKHPQTPQGTHPQPSPDSAPEGTEKGVAEEVPCGGAAEVLPAVAEAAGVAVGGGGGGGAPSPLPSMPPALQGEELAALEERAARDIASINSIDIYRLWRARGRPAQGVAGEAPPLPGYTSTLQSLRRAEKQRYGRPLAL